MPSLVEEEARTNRKPEVGKRPLASNGRMHGKMRKIGHRRYANTSATTDNYVG